MKFYVESMKRKEKGEAYNYVILRVCLVSSTYRDDSDVSPEKTFPGS